MLFKPKGEPILAAVSGEIIPLGEVQSPIFAGRVVGDGVAIIPASGEVKAPISGTVAFVGAQKHTFGITGFDGLEVLIHLGIGTVELDGKGFTPLVSAGQKVEAGQRIAIVDWDLVKEAGFDTTCPEVITSTSIDRIKRLTVINGHATAGQSPCMRYVIGK